MEVDVREDLEVGQEVHFGATLLGLAGDLHRRDLEAVALLDDPVLRNALLELHEVRQALAAHGQAQPLRQAVDAAHTHAVQAARDLVAVLVELATGVQFGQRDFGRRTLGLVLVVHLHAGRNAAAVVGHRDRVVGVDGDHDVIAVASERLADRVVDHLEHEVVQTGAVGGVADVHAGALAHRFQAFEDLDRAFAVGVFAAVAVGAHAQGAAFDGRCRALHRQRAVGRLAGLVAVGAGDLGLLVVVVCFGVHQNVGHLSQIRIGITTYLKPAWSGTVIKALELVSCSSIVTISWPMLASASIR